MQPAEHYIWISLRCVLVYSSIIIAFRLAGKKHVAQLSLIDFILILLVSDAVQSAMVGEDITVEGGIIAAVTLIATNVLLTKLTVKSPGVARIIEGEPVLLVRNGRILYKHVTKENLRVEEIHEAMHKEGISKISDVALAILETDGAISIIPQNPAKDV
jgi:uncharacterized membrane protein YcaP (DUF421 family)